MNKFIVMSPCYETIRYGKDLIKKRTIDAHTGGKYSKFIINSDDLKDPTKLPTPENFKFEPCQAEDADIVIYTDEKKTITLKGEELDK